MAQQLRVQAVLIKDPDSVPSTQMVGDSQPSVTQAPMGLGSDTFSGLVGHQACIWCTSIHKKTHTHVGKTVIHMKPEMRKIEMCVMFLLQSTDKRPNSISIPYLKFTINKTMPNL